MNNSEHIMSTKYRNRSYDKSIWLETISVDVMASFPWDFYGLEPGNISSNSRLFI